MGAFLKLDLEKNASWKVIVMIPAGYFYYAKDLSQWKLILKSTIFCVCLWQSLSPLVHALSDGNLGCSSLVQVFWPKTRFV